MMGCKVHFVMNITDIDDKMINRATEEGIAVSDLAARYETHFFADLDKLAVLPADVYPRASEHFPEMKTLLNTLIDKGFAYEKGGEAYFDISKFKDYGRLSQLANRQIKVGARVEVQEYDKDDASDFVLWKLDEGTKGPGRPGWHLECSAMSMKYLGSTIDLHVGGADLIFPHHENEIAQSEAATGQTFARQFVHGEMVTVEGNKMAKSDGNFYTLDDIEKWGIDPLAFRYLTLQTHYRSRLNFSRESLEASERALDGVRRLAYYQSELSDEQKQTALKEGMEAIKDDLDLPGLLAILHKASDFALWLAFEPVLGLKLDQIKPEIPSEITELATARQSAKEQGDYQKADQIRNELKTTGWDIEDTAEGYRLIPVRGLDK